MQLLFEQGGKNLKLAQLHHNTLHTNIACNRTHEIEFQLNSGGISIAIR